MPLPVGPGDDDKALVQVAELLDGLRELQLLEGEDLRGDLAEHRGLPPVVVEEVPAEPRESRDLVGEVQVLALEEVLPAPLRDDLLEQLLDGGCVSGWSPMGMIEPEMRAFGGCPTMMWRSEPPLSTIDAQECVDLGHGVR